MTNYYFTTEENTLIEKCMGNGHKFWDDPCLSNLKKRLKNHLIATQGNTCCYCYRNIKNEFNMVLDIEHILPKFKFKRFMFDLNNLAVSCKRCNLEIKRNSLDFIFDINNILDNPFESNQYLFIHPIFDKSEDHIYYLTVQENRNILTFYTVKNHSPKGQFAYDFFKLKDFTIDSFDRGQGIEINISNEKRTEISKIISDEISELSKNI